MSLPFPAALVPVRAAGLRVRLGYLAACWWWSLRVHVAESHHHLPRGSAGPPPAKPWP
jgi:hypothetical protein